MGALDGGNDALHAGELVAGPDGLVVVDGQHGGAVLGGQVGVHGPYAGIVEAGRDGASLHDLAVGGLHHQGLAAVQDTQAPGMYRGCRVAAVDAVAAGLGQHDAHALIVDIVVDGARGVAAAAHAGHQIVGIVAARLLLQLRLDFLAYHALQAGHHVGIGMRPHGRPYHIEGVVGVTAPVAYGLVGGILEGVVAREHRHHRGPQHLHALHIGVLALDVERTLVDHARHVHEGAHGGRGHAVLAGARLGDDALLAHLLGQQHLPYGVVDLVGTGVVQVLALEVEPAAVLVAHAPGMVERRGATHIVAQQHAVLVLKLAALDDVEILRTQRLDRGIEYLGHIGAAILPIVAVLVGQKCFFRLHFILCMCFHTLFFLIMKKTRRHEIATGLSLRIL